jgi:hypothetical protein
VSGQRGAKHSRLTLCSVRGRYLQPARESVGEQFPPDRWSEAGRAGVALVLGLVVLRRAPWLVRWIQS